MHLLRHKLTGDESGQTLIETLIAIFVLVTALTTGLGLAIYALTTSRTSTAEIVASNLAREGVDVVRMMRDSNWLAGDEAGGIYALTDCPDLPAGKQQCYSHAYVGPSYHIATPGPYRLVFDPDANTWTLQDGDNNYNLYLQADGTYTPTVRGVASYARKIVIDQDTTSPYTIGNPELIIQSIVGWTGKNCSTMTNTDPETTNCKVVVEEDLTNWKDYQ